MSDERYPYGRFGTPEMPERPRARAVGDTLNIHYLDDTRSEPAEIHEDDVPLGAAVARGLEQLEADTIAEADERHRGKRRVGRIVELEAALRSSAERSVEHADERRELLRTIRELREQRPDTLRGVARRTVRDLATIARRRLWS